MFLRYNIFANQGSRSSTHTFSSPLVSHGKTEGMR